MQALKQATEGTKACLLHPTTVATPPNRAIRTPDSHFLTTQLTGERQKRECKTRNARKKPAPATQTQNLAMTRREARQGRRVRRCLGEGWTASGSNGSWRHRGSPPGPGPYLQFPLPGGTSSEYEREQRPGRMKIKEDQFRISCAFRGPRPHVRRLGLT
ncbi:hypothetical protein P7K49_012479 [Saguinus oedipus]|uniref:Uncharacterized protein n=1 Tax=Saguinus oedipus TaxID=9490 RepID=A0ABQ9VX68_SAGOE|nr:hypothetical protein P7K49_012479 [Saguinus oedipus]